MRKIEEEGRFKQTVQIIEKDVKFKNFIEIGGTDASFKNHIKHKSWKILDKYGDPDIKINLDGIDAKLPFGDNSIECFILTEVLEHLRIGTPLIEEISRCLVKDGCLVISVPNAVSLGNRIQWLFGKVPFMAASGDCGHELGGTGMLIDGYWQGGHVIDFNKNRLQKYMERANLKYGKFYQSATVIKGIAFPKALTTVTTGNFLIGIFKKT